MFSAPAASYGVNSARRAAARRARGKVGAPDVTCGDTLVADDKLAYGKRIIPRGDRVTVGGETYGRVALPKPQPPPARWQGLIGGYGWNHDVLYILEKDGRLWVLIEWLEFDPLKEVSENVSSSRAADSTTASGPSLRATPKGAPRRSSGGVWQRFVGERAILGL
jgi:hypothetical protein